ncbi:hypothetical protein [Thalassospira lohafexi]|uniref:hypothetical protein n=1 Tax=Thalassospira lohafexi TaxID=744227 RepID=UPI0013FD80E0|nr:hypothetical protein [Thalassospira lohafexi]
MSDFFLGAVWMFAIITALWLGFENWGDGGGWAIFVAVLLAVKDGVNLKFKSSETE